MNTTKSIKILIALSILVMALHILIVSKLIPYEVVWGGRLNSDTEMIRFELISIFINLILIFTLLIKGKFIKLDVNQCFINVLLWIFFALFILNSIGNLLAKTVFEKILALITFYISFLLWNVLKSSSHKIK